MFVETPFLILRTNNILKQGFLSFFMTWTNLSVWRNLALSLRKKKPVFLRIK